MRIVKFKYGLEYILVFLLLPIIAIAQNETNNWYFGDHAGLNFNYGQFSQLNNSNMSTPAGCSSFSNSSGEILFYTNGNMVWNRNHEVMVNGTDLNAETLNNQATLIVPDTVKPDIFYILTTKTSDPNPGIYYSKVEISQEYPLGIVLTRNVRITYNSTERLTAIHSPETNSIKVVGLGYTDTAEGSILNRFYIINVGENINTPATSPTLINEVVVEQTFYANSGIMKFSPNGEFIAIGDDGDGYSGLYIYTFDTQNNTVSYFKTINAGYLFTPIPVYGIEFSADSQFIYFSGNYNDIGYLHKFLLPSTDDLTQKIIIETSQTHQFGNLQLASNGKIYMANFSIEDPFYFNQLSVINNPEDFNNIEYEPLSITLNESNSTKGLPNFIASYFRNRIITENKCVTEAFEFDLDAYDQIDSVIWEFGDGNTSTDFNPTHLYTTAGEYTVKATITLNGKPVELYKVIEAFPLPEFDNATPFVQCDLDNDGISNFNLSEISNAIQNPWPEQALELHFYETLLDLQNDTNEISNSFYFENTSNPQQIFVEIINAKGCSITSDFYIEVQQQNLGVIPRVVTCEGSDYIYNNGLGSLNLSEKSQEIREQFDVPENSEISFYNSLEDALTNTNRLSHTLTSASTTLWIKIIDDAYGCQGIATMEFLVNSPIILDIEETYQLCELQPFETLDGNASNTTWEWSNSSGELLSTQREFLLTTPGDYQVAVTRQENGIECSATKSFRVLPISTPTFSNVEIMDTNLHIDILGQSSYEYSLDNLNFYGSGTTHTFYNVEPGIIDVYVRDINNCETSIQTKKSFIYAPKFFSPNGDNLNDIWTVKGVSESLYLEAEILVFDRYGKILYTINLQNIDLGWNGMFNNELLPNSDYWYKAYLKDKDQNITEFFGHFSLLR